MSVTKNYNRDKDPAINDTPIDLTVLVGEKPDAPAAIGGTGTTGDLDMRLQADADETAGVDVQDIFQVETAYVLGANGAHSMTVTVTPILGDGSAGTPVITTVPHEETMDVWQVAAGRPQQP